MRKPQRLRRLQKLKALASTSNKKSKGQHDDRDAWLQRVAEHGADLIVAPVHLREDREVVMTAVAQNGWALEFATEELRGDREVVMAAVAQTGWALEHAAEELRGDKEIMEVALARASATGNRSIGLKARLNSACLLSFLLASREAEKPKSVWRTFGAWAVILSRDRGGGGFPFFPIWPDSETAGLLR